MKKRKAGRLILPALLILLIVACGTVFAYMFSRTEYKDNQFTPAVVSCEVHEMTDAGVTEKSSIMVKNTGNIDAYLRVRFVSYWVQITEEGGTEIVAEESFVPEVKPASGWLKGANDTYYYQSPVAPDKTTGELLSEKMTLEVDEETGYMQVIEVFAEAIQSRPKDAVETRWLVEVDDTSIIMKVP